jgi:hypothetical protein
MCKYEVPIVYRGQCNYVIEAVSANDAEVKARAMFANGDAPDTLGNEWETIERVGDVQPVPLMPKEVA